MSRTPAATLVFLVAMMLLATPSGALDRPEDTVDGTLVAFDDLGNGLPSTGEFLFCIAGDLNGDGYEDIAAAANNNSQQSPVLGLRVYTCKGGTSWEDNSTGLPTLDRYGGIGLGDMDGDGDVDIVAGIEVAEGSSNQGISVWVNNGTVGGKLSWVRGASPITTGTYMMVTVADIDDDGNLDVVAGAHSRGMKVWTGNGGAGGTLSFTQASTGLPTNGDFTGVAVGDLNGDGDADIVACDYNPGGPETHLWTGDGAGSWTSQDSSFPDGSQTSMGIDVGDVDGDGNEDIVWGGRDNAVMCILGNGGGSDGQSFCWTSADSGLSTTSRYSMVRLADIDVDGDLDLLAASDGRGLELYLGNGGSGGTMDWTLADAGLPTSGNFYGADFGDFNRDGVLDVAGAHYQRRVVGGLRAYTSTVTGAHSPTAMAVWGGTGSDVASVILGARVTMDGTGSLDPEDAPEGDAAGLNLTYDWNVTSVPSGSAITDADLAPTDANATPAFMPDAIGGYTITLAVRDRDGHWSIGEATLELSVLKPNLPPVADAGPDQTVFTNETVQLDGRGSFDPDGEVAVYVWGPVPGNPALVDLQGWNTSVASFVAPMVEGVYAFALRVMDDNGSWSEVDFANVTVGEPPNQPPVARAGPDSAVVLGETIELNGSASYDLDGELVAWQWNCTSHPAVAVQGGDSAVATAVPLETGQYAFSLRVQDDRGEWSPADTVDVLVVAPDVNLPPVAVIAGPSLLETAVNSSVALDGSGSSDEDGSVVEFLWNCTSHPGMSFDGQNTTILRYTPTDDGDYVFTLAVRDDNGSWSLEEASVTVRARLPPPPPNEAPVAVISGPEEPVEVGALVTLTASSSSDPDGEVVDWGWVCTSHEVSVDGYNTSTVGFSPGMEGTYTFQLRVMDDDGAWSTAVTFDVEAYEPNLPPVVVVLSPQEDETLEYKGILLVAWEASDPNGDELVFRIEVWQMGELVHTEAGIPSDVRSFNLSGFTVMGGMFNLKVIAEETSTEERLSTLSEDVRFWLMVDDILPEPDEEVVEAFSILWLMLITTLAIIIVVVVVVVVFVVYRERAPAPPVPSHGMAGLRMAMCPQCGGPMDYDNAFGRPYCRRCDRYH